MNNDLEILHLRAVTRDVILAGATLINIGNWVFKIGGRWRDGPPGFSYFLIIWVMPLALNIGLSIGEIRQKSIYRKAYGINTLCFGLFIFCYIISQPFYLGIFNN